ncbi:MAG: hypothetical protein M1827_004139 [Pycnora praestabilis]|nr:MAG: hypothetical protein M1827_004139 [Pycnora praestabilis]
MRVGTQPQSTNGRFQPIQSRAFDDSQADDSDSGAEGRARKRFQKTPSGDDAPLGKSVSSIVSARNPADSRPNFTSRRRSTRDQKAPLGPRPHDFSPSGRTASDNLHNPFDDSTRSAIPDSISASTIRQSSTSDTPRFDFGKQSDNGIDNTDTSNSSFELLPSANFDDLHNSIPSTDPKLSEFPAPRIGRGGRGEGGILARKIINGTSNDVRGDERVPTGGTGIALSGSRIGRSGSFLRRQNNSQQGGQTTAQSNAMGPPIAPLALRTRRQSQFPPPTSTTAPVKTPRKSVGSGSIGGDYGDKAAQRRRPSLTTKDAVTSTVQTDSVGLQPLRNQSSGNANPVDQPESSKSSTTPRTMKTKSLLPPPRQAQSQLFSPSMTPDHTRPSSIYAARSPGKSPGRRTNSPLSSSKRLSVMPSHATGLGARTISPTDTRRLKRLSTLQNPPPMPSTPPTPQPDLPPDLQPEAPSPSMVSRKSLTPSSSRTTPDHNRKSHSHGPSFPSSTSLISARIPTLTSQARLSQSISTSRLPTPRPGSVHSSRGGEEGVPPVPAIPKAYESPKETTEQPFFTIRKSSLPFDSSSFTSTSTADCVPIAPPATEHSLPGWESRSVRGLPPGSGEEHKNKISMPPSVNRKNLQPLRLPPLNLLPLSTPTAAKIAALHEPSLDLDVGKITPPPKRGPTKTPSTPMTASKASFFSKNQREHDYLALTSQERSSSSHHALRPEPFSIRTASSSSSSAPMDVEPQPPRKAKSPYMSTSLPKSSGDFSYGYPKSSGESDTGTFGSELRSTRLTGPRAQTSTKEIGPEDSNRTSSPTEPDTSLSGSSLRRKLSLTWKKTTSKTANVATDPDTEYNPQAQKHDNMPPPRLPASATWTGPLVPSPSPSLLASSQVDSKRRQSSFASLMTGHDRSRSDNWGTNATNRNPKKEIMGPPDLPEATITSRATSSILSPMHKILSSKGSLSAMKNRQVDTNLDRDDLSAEEEMRKLASKRKDFEVAAREVDELRRRATPKERVSPTQALRVVNLNIFERGEIIDYKEIYFCGTQNAKKHVGDLNAQSANFGYDDDRGDYNIVEGDHLAYRYEIVDILGKGSFGQVVRCVDHKSGILMAIKIIRNKKRFHQQALVEVNILQKLREWDPLNNHSMVNFTQSFYFRGHLCISTELLGMNLYEFIKSNDFRGFSLKLIRRFSKQLLSSLVLLKGRKVIHCDLKPENILLAHPIHSEIKVIDFGSSCFENEKVYTYIQSRFYRSPEVILGMTYGLPIDMWSLGCILAELFTGYPIFPGENEQEQLACIMEVFGPPEKHLIEKSTRKKLFFDSLGKPRLTVSSKGRRRRPSSKSLSQALKCDDESFLDFITRCLRWDPDRRLKPDEAIQHEFVTGIKTNARSRLQQVANNSPIKRVNSVQSATSTRPLPEPPATSFRNGTAVRSRDVPSSSPSKPAAPKRHSTINGLQPSVGVKRTSTGTAVGSNLPRVAPRSVSGRPDMASAAAAMSLKSR